MFIEGNIGAGKSTLIHFFDKFEDIEVFSEPVKQWQNMNGHNVLQMFYENPQTNGFAFQMYVFLTMMKEHLKPITKQIKVMEGSVFNTWHCFTTKLAENKFIDNMSKEELNQWFNFLTNQYKIEPNYVIYLRTSPSTIIERINQRGRQEEKSITIEYLNDLHELHEKWIASINPKTQKTIIIDGNQSKEEIEKDALKCISLIKTRGEVFKDGENVGSITIM